MPSIREIEPGKVGLCDINSGLANEGRILSMLDEDGVSTGYDVAMTAHDGSSTAEINPFISLGFREIYGSNGNEAIDEVHKWLMSSGIVHDWDRFRSITLEDVQEQFPDMREDILLGVTALFFTQNIPGQIDEIPIRQELEDEDHPYYDRLVSRVYDPVEGDYE